MRIALPSSFNLASGAAPISVDGVLVVTLVLARSDAITANVEAHIRADWSSTITRPAVFNLAVMAAAVSIDVIAIITVLLEVASEDFAISTLVNADIRLLNGTALANPAILDLAVLGATVPTHSVAIIAFIPSGCVGAITADWVAHIW